MAKVKQEIQAALPQAQVASSKDVADTISGSLSGAPRISRTTWGSALLDQLAASPRFLLAALLALSCVRKRVRELRTLKALGWTQRMVVRHLWGESLATGDPAGGLFRDRRLGVLVAVLVDAFGPSLTASSTTGSDLANLGVSTRWDHNTPAVVADGAGWDIRPSRSALGLALLGGLIAGTTVTLRAARLPARRRPCGMWNEPVRADRRRALLPAGADHRPRARRREPRDRARWFGALEGPSGSGKTTLLQILGALDRPSGNGDVQQQICRQAARLGAPRPMYPVVRFRLPAFNLIPTLTAVENVEAKLAPGGGSEDARSELPARSGWPSARTIPPRTCCGR